MGATGTAAAVTAIITAAAAAATVTAGSWAQPTSRERLDGWATYYAPGVMPRVAANRGLVEWPDEFASWLRMQGAIGGVALNKAGDLGRRVWLAGPDGIEGPFVAVDCARWDHYGDRERRQRVVEVDWPTAERWAMAGPVPVTVYFTDPRRAFNVRATRRLHLPL